MLLVVGLGMWVVNLYIPMPSSIKTILNIIVLVSVGVWAIQAAGLWGPVTSFRHR